ncbi:hypothetical protein AB4305_26410 [Nocardia sp. 2YAB30]|uniref:hypothetical protein n=1 Tax=unclassified Nocardia TaxID=2637762 RepID=UPI003F988791
MPSDLPLLAGGKQIGTTIYWNKRGIAESVARFTWAIPADAAPGRYSFQHSADSLEYCTVHPDCERIRSCSSATWVG